MKLRFLWKSILRFPIGCRSQFLQSEGKGKGGMVEDGSAEGRGEGFQSGKGGRRREEGRGRREQGGGRREGGGRGRRKREEGGGRKEGVESRE
jgi:hypothetical protein